MEERGVNAARVPRTSQAILHPETTRGHLSLWPHVTPPTILGLAGTVVWLQQVTFHTAAREGAIRVGAELAAGAVHRALIKVCQEKKSRAWSFAR